MTKQIPELIIPEWATQFQIGVLKAAYDIVKGIIENYDGDGEPNFNTLMSFAIEQEEEIQLEEYKMAWDALRKGIDQTSDWKDIGENWQEIKKHPKMKALVEKHFSETIKELEAIRAHEDLSLAEKKWQEKKWIIIIWSTILWLAIYKYWGAFMWFIIWYYIHSSLSPMKFMKRYITKGNNNKQNKIDTKK